MDKKRRGILILVLIWAGLLIAFLYSPLGSPELYAPVGYSVVNGVDFENITIENAPKFGNYAFDNSSSPFVVTPYQTETESSTYRVDNSVHVESNRSSSATGYEEMSSGRTNNGTGSGESFVTSAVRKSDSRSSAISSGPGIMTLTTDLTQTDNNTLTTPKTIGYTPGSGATDPGGDPTEPLIPVGDGLPFLIMMVAVYAVWKRMRM